MVDVFVGKPLCFSKLLYEKSSEPAIMRLDFLIQIQQLGDRGVDVVRAHEGLAD